MTDTAGDNKPFPGFPGFPPAEMLDKMWDMMRLTPFGVAFPGMHPGTAQGLGSPLAAMSDMMSPLMSVEELDKRITDMRAVEQWLKLNLNMLQSAIQALEVQRATLATLRAFGAFAQASMTQPARDAPGAQSARPEEAAAAFAGPADDKNLKDEGGRDEETAESATHEAPFDPSAWWNLLQSQFNQLASFAMAQPGAGTSSTGAEDGTKNGPDDPPAKMGAARKAGAANGKRAASPAKPAPKRPAAGKTGGKTAGSSSRSSPSSRPSTEK
jgi:hypothetical protein